MFFYLWKGSVGEEAESYRRASEQWGAGEALHLFLKHLPGFKTIGTDTPGLYAYALPNSRVLFQGGWFAFEDQSLAVEGTGFRPTYYYWGDKPEKAALSLITESLK